MRTRISAQVVVAMLEKNVGSCFSLSVYRVMDVIYQTRAPVFHRDTQTPRRELKIRRAAEYF